LSSFYKLKENIKLNYNLYRVVRNIYGLGKGLKGFLLNKKGSMEHIKSTLSLIQKTGQVKGKPIIITIEPTNICNLKCPVCETGAGILKRRPQYLKYNDFKIIIDKIYKFTNTIMYYFMGEPFLNKNWVKEVRYAKEKGIPWIETCTNGDYANPKDIIESGIDFVSFQIAGMTQGTHQIYRVGSNLERVIKNLIDTIEIKKRTNSKVHIEVGFIVMKHNEHEIEKFINFARKIGVDSFNIISPAVRTVEQGKLFLPKNNKYWIYDRNAFEKGLLKRKVQPKNDCPWIYYSMVIMANGDVVPCCHDPLGKFVMGNILKQDFDEIWNGEKFRKFREKIHTNQKEISICRLCGGYGIPWLR